MHNLTCRYAQFNMSFDSNGTKYNKIAGNVSFEYVEGVFNKSGGMVCG